MRNDGKITTPVNLNLWGTRADCRHNDCVVVVVLVMLDGGFAEKRIVSSLQWIDWCK